MSDLNTSVEKLFRRTANGIKPGLDVIEALLKELGNPQQSLKVIHVAGTNGKGSVCAMIESVLRCSGYKTGLYTSPHLLRFNERFRVNGAPILNSDLASLIDDVETAAEKVQIRPATFFEMSTAIAFEYFKRSGVDYAVIETGMGGCWDATNVVQPILSVITRVDYDHAEFLGDDLRQIASEKAGIIKPGVPVVCGPMPVEAEAVIYQKAAEVQAPILGSEEAVFFDVLEGRRTDQLVDIEASGEGFRGVRLGLGGSFQLENCGIAVAALEDLSDLENLRLNMKKGLESVTWPGRFQMLSMKPPIVFDGAHNPGAMSVLVQSLQETFPSFSYGIVLGVMKDKNLSEMLKMIPSKSRIWAVTLPGDRAMTAEAIVQAGKEAGLEIDPLSGLSSALEWVEEGKRRVLCFAGSFCFAEELRKQGLFNGV
jgi:dihydrofolate synthase/folylpolyglutamate synthase